MAMIPDGGSMLRVPYTRDWDNWVSQAQTTSQAFYINGNIGNVTTSQGSLTPPMGQGFPGINETSSWTQLAVFKLYTYTLPPLPAPQIPVYTQTQDTLSIEYQLDDVHTYTDQHDPYQGYIENGKDGRMWMRVVLHRFGEDPVVLVNQNQSGGTRRFDVDSWVQGWIYEGAGLNISGVGGIYQSNVNDEGEIISDIDELFGMIIWLASGPRIKSTGNVDFRQQRATGVGVNLTKLGYSMQFIDTDEDPYVDPEEDDDGFSGPGGGDGDHDKTTDQITIPPDPTISATSCGFVSLYNPTLAEINQLAAQINSETFFDTLKNFFEHAQDYIAGLAILPVQPTIAGQVHPKMGWHTLDVAMNLIASQYVTVNCGSINVREFYGSSFDYAPLTQLQLFLPYIGYVNLNTDEVMDKTLNVTYKVDVYNGNAVAFVLADGSIIGQYNGNCMQEVPVSSITFDDVIRNSIMLAVNVGSGLVSMGAALGGAGANQSAQTQVDMAQAQGNLVSAVGSGLVDVMTSKPRVERSGTLGSSLGLMSVQKPHLIKIIPRQSLPKDYKTICGYPSNITATLSQLSGYVQVDKIHISGITGTEDERKEIIALLNGGVII